MTSTPVVTSTLPSRIKAFERTLAAWLATSKDGGIETECREYDSFEAAEFELVEYQCETHEEVQQKVQFARGSRELRDSIASDRTMGGKSYLALFIETLCLPAIPRPDRTGDIPW